GGAAAPRGGRALATGAPPTMRWVRPSIPAALDRIVLRGLDRDKGKRWQDLESLRQALKRFLPGQMSFGGLANRFVAYVIDVIVRALLLMPIGLLWAKRFGEAAAVRHCGR